MSTDNTLKPSKTTAQKKTAKVADSPFVEVVVVAPLFGRHKKGVKLKMHISTANACVASGVVEIV